MATEQEIKVYKAYARKMARLVGMEGKTVAIFLAQIDLESGGWDPEAYNEGSKAYGFGQITPHYVDEHGKTHITHKDGFDGLQAHRAFWPKDRADEVKGLTDRLTGRETPGRKERKWKINLEYSARFMKFLIDLNDGDVFKALSDYNAGEGSAPGSRLRKEGNQYAETIIEDSVNEVISETDLRFSEMHPDDIHVAMKTLDKARNIAGTSTSQAAPGLKQQAAYKRLRDTLTEQEKKVLREAFGIEIPGEWNDNAPLWGPDTDIHTEIENIQADALEASPAYLGVNKASHKEKIENEWRRAGTFEAESKRQEGEGALEGTEDPDTVPSAVGQVPSAEPPHGRGDALSTKIRGFQKSLEGLLPITGNPSRAAQVEGLQEILRELQVRVDAGEIEAQIDSVTGEPILPSVLDELEIVQNQMQTVLTGLPGAGEHDVAFVTAVLAGLGPLDKLSPEEIRGQQSMVAQTIRSAIQRGLVNVRGMEGGEGYTPKVELVMGQIHRYVASENAEAIKSIVHEELGVVDEGASADSITVIIDNLTKKIRDAKDPMTREMAIRTFGYAVEAYKELVKDKGQLPADWAAQEKALLEGFAELSPDQAQARANQLIQNRMDLRKLETQEEEAQFKRLQGLEALEEGRTRYAREEQIDVRENIRAMQQRQQEQTTGIHRAVAASQQALASEYLGHAPKFGPVTPGAKIGGANIYEQLAESRGIVDPKYLGYGSAVPSLPQASDMQAFHEALANARAKLAYGSEAEVIGSLPTYTPMPGHSAPRKAAG